MKSAAELFKVLGDEQRLRLLMLLARKELSVCQLTGILGASQPLISRNLAILNRAGFLAERREGKLKFYRIREDITGDRQAALQILSRFYRQSSRHRKDLEILRECGRFQKKVGRCDMQTFYEFQEHIRRKNNDS